jgi:hypothetical protein
MTNAGVNVSAPPNSSTWFGRARPQQSRAEQQREQQVEVRLAIEAQQRPLSRREHDDERRREQHEDAAAHPRDRVIHELDERRPVQEENPLARAIEKRRRAQVNLGQQHEEERTRRERSHEPSRQPEHVRRVLDLAC